MNRMLGTSPLNLGFWEYFTLIILCLLSYLSLLAILSLDHCFGDLFQNGFCQSLGFAVQYYILVMYPRVTGSGITRFL